MVRILDTILEKIAEYICGDTKYPFPYRTGSQLSIFFGSAGLAYSHDGTSRKMWTLEVLKEINNNTEGGLPSRNLIKVIESLGSPENSETPNQQYEQIITINHLIEQFNLEIGIVDNKKRVKLFYINEITGEPEYYKDQIKIISSEIEWIRNTVINQDEKGKKYDVFLSYATPDEKNAIDLKFRLEEREISCFMAKLDIEAGLKWDPEIRNALKKAKILIILITPQSIDRKWVQPCKSHFIANPSIY